MPFLNKENILGHQITNDLDDLDVLNLTWNLSRQIFDLLF